MYETHSDLPLPVRTRMVELLQDARSSKRHLLLPATARRLAARYGNTSWAWKSSVWLH